MPSGGTDWNEGLDARAVSVREVYARYGLAMYHAQVLEHGVVNALVMTRRSKGPGVTAHDIDAMFESRLEKSLGSLISELSARVPVPPALHEELRDALSIRNFLAHDYFKVRSEDFMTESGRDRMIRELQKLADRLSYVDGRLEPVTEAAFEKMGIAKPALRAFYEEYLARFRAE